MGERGCWREGQDLLLGTGWALQGGGSWGGRRQGAGIPPRALQGGEGTSEAWASSTGRSWN